MKLTTQPTLANGGDAVARAPDGRVVFIEGAAPNEYVEVEITQSKKKFAKARVIKILEDSPDRAEPKCKNYEFCGGCTSQHITSEAQTRSKQDALSQTLKRIGKIDLESVVVQEPWTGNAYGYRNRARLALAPGNVVGFRAPFSNNIIDIEECPVLSPLAQKTLDEIRRLNLRAKEIEEIELIAAAERAMVLLPKKYSGVVKNKSGELRYVFSAKGRSIPANDGCGDLLLSPGVFAQSNADGNVAMINYLVSLIPSSEHLLELYAGSGNFTRAFCGRAARIEIVEGAGPAIELAKRSLPSDVEIHESSVEDFLEQKVSEGLTGVDVLVDPPRSGLSKDAVNLLRKLKPSSLVYVSCDPVTFARDLGLLSDLYGLTQVKLFDLYPHTGHSELIGHLKSL